MKSKFSATLFEKRYGHRGGLAKLVVMRINGATLQEIGNYFGLDTGRISRICTYLIENSDLPSKSEIESDFLKRKVASATQNKHEKNK